MPINFGAISDIKKDLGEWVLSDAFLQYNSVGGNVRVVGLGEEDERAEVYEGEITIDDTLVRTRKNIVNEERARIIFGLRNQSKSVGEIADLLGLEVSAVVSAVDAIIAGQTAAR